MALAALIAAVGWRALTPASEVAAGDRTYREAVVGELPPLDPLVARQAPRDPDVTALLYRGLVAVDERGRARPDLAERWEVDADGRVYRFYLRSGLRWDDGVPLAVQDVLFSLRRAARSGESSFWAAVEVWSPGPDVVEVVPREPLGALLEHAALPIVAAHAPPGGEGRPASSGPYRVGVGQADALILERNPSFEGPAVEFERVELLAMASREEALQALLDGRVDALAGLSPAEVAAIAGSERQVVYQAPEYGKHAVLVLNLQAGPFEERAVRLAVSQAIDRERLVEMTLEGLGEPAYGPIPPLSWAHEAGLPFRQHAPAAARETLASAGWALDAPDGTLWRDGRPLALTLLTSDSPPRLREAEEVARQLGLVGFRVEVRPVAAERLVREHLDPGAFEAALIGRWLPETDPDQFALWHSTQARGVGGNYGGASLPEFDHWLEVGRRQVAADARAEAYRRFQAAWAEDQPAVLLYHPHTAWAMGRQVRGVAAGPLPDASWRLRGLPSWYREAEPAGWRWPLGR